MEIVTLKIKRLEYAKDLPMPKYMTEGSSGMDLYAAVSEQEIIESGKIKLIPVGITIILPPGYEAQIRPRSGLAVKWGITVINSPGTIDSDYRGELKVALVNLGDYAFKINRGDRIAQMMVQKCPQVELLEIDNVPTSDRNEGGFGHTG